MNHRIKNKRGGFSLVEVMVSVAVGTIVIGGGLFGVTQIYTGVNRATINHKVESQIYELIQAMVQSGRLAQRCAKEDALSAPAAVSLRCVLDRGDANLKYIRYHKANNDNKITFETSDTIPDATPIAWNVSTTYGGPDQFQVTDFTLCTDTEMATGNCTLLPIALNTFYGQACDTGGATSDQRCFRFSISAQDPAGLRQYQFQSAFFVRAPAPDGITYAWGSKQ